MLQSHLTVLKASANTFQTSPVFKVPVLDSSSQHIESWRSVSYQSFHDDVESYARHWQHTFRRDGIPLRSAIGLWIGGYSYSDVVHIYAISRAGYIPQLISLRLPNPEVIYELLQKADARALVYDAAFEDILDACPVPRYPESCPDFEETLETLPETPAPQPDETVFIFHTSGSTSGIPKVIPCSYAWLNTVIRKSYDISRPRAAGRLDVTVAMGSLCHIGQTTMFLGSLQHGACVVIPTSMAFSAIELGDMITRCGLNRLNQFAPFLVHHLRAARSDPKVFSLLDNLDELLYSGALPREEEDWGFRSGLKLRNLFGTTECSIMLMSGESKGSNPSLLSPTNGFTYQFRSTAPASSTSTHQSTAQLMELIIPASSPDCPHVSLRHSDGDFHTGDLFQEVSQGMYMFRGRDDDWIKSENCLRCDTKAIEDNAMAMCQTLIAACVVVGSGRPSPAIFVEPAVEMDHEKLKKEIIRKTRHFHSRRYLHERITMTDLIIVVHPRSLPRTATKGNIRRKAVEEAYKVQLDEVYARIRR